MLLDVVKASHGVVVVFVCVGEFSREKEGSQDTRISGCI